MGFSVRRRRKENSHTWRKGNHLQHFLFVRCRSIVMVTEREQAGVMTTDLSLMGRIRKTGMYVRDHISFLFKYTITMHKSFTAHTKRSHRQNQMSNTKELIPYLLGNTFLNSLPQFFDTWDISFYSGFCPKNNNLVPGTVT